MSTAIVHAPTAPALPVPAPALNRYEVSRLPVRRFTVDEYHRLIEQGYFAADERFELLEGWIVAKVSKNPPHEAYIGRGLRMLGRRLRPGWFVRVQGTVTTGDSEPQPDSAVVKGDDELDYEARHPTAADTALVVEVSSSTLADDRGIMARIYARAGFSTYWIINLVDRQIEVYTEPSGPTADPSYLRRTDYRAGQVIPFIVGGSELGPVLVTDFLP